MIRDAKAVDIPAIIELLERGYERTHYSKSGLVRIDVDEAKKLLLNAIFRHGRKSGGACWVQVSETLGQLSGLIVGNLQRVYSIGDKLVASDLFWTTNGFAEPGDALALMRGMISWAWSCPAVIEINCGATAIINNDPEMAGRLLGQLGMKRYGVLYRMEREMVPA